MQPSGIRAFIPKPLPLSESPVDIDGGILELLSNANNALARLDGSVATLPAPDAFVRMYARKEAVLSSRIEGTLSTLRDLLTAEAGVTSVPANRADTEEILNYVQAMKKGFSLMNELPLSKRLIKEVHAELLKGVRGESRAPGEFRQNQVWIGPVGAGIGDAVFVPPPANMVEQCMGEFETYMNSDTMLPPLIKIGLAHVQFETIHPFLDGNGRVGRLLIAFMLSNEGLLNKPVLYLSSYFMKHRRQYYDALQEAQNEGGLQKWIEYFLQGVAEVGKQAAETTQRIILLREQDRVTALKEFGRSAYDAYSILEHLYANPIVSVSEIQKLTSRSRQAAAKTVQRFVECGILKELSGKMRYRYFIYEKYVQLFPD